MPRCGCEQTAERTMTRQDGSRPHRALHRARSGQDRCAPLRGGLTASLDQSCARRCRMLQAGAGKRPISRTEKRGLQKKDLQFGPRLKSGEARVVELDQEILAP